MDEFPRNWAVRNLLMQLLRVVLKTKITGSLKLDLGSREKEIPELERDPRQLGGADYLGSGQCTLLMAQTQIMAMGSVTRHPEAAFREELPEETLSCKDWLWETPHPGNSWGLVNSSHCNDVFFRV